MTRVSEEDAGGGARAARRPPSASTYEIAVDDLYPRDERHRYRIYARRGPDLEVLAACEAGGIGLALVQLDDDERERGRRLMDRGALGVLDAVERRWIVLPWHRPERNASVGRLAVAIVEGFEWVGRTVRSRQGAGRGTGRLWRVEVETPHGFRLIPVAGGSPKFRTAEQLDRLWTVVNEREEAPHA